MILNKSKSERIIMVTSDQGNQGIVKEFNIFHGNQRKIRKFSKSLDKIGGFCKLYLLCLGRAKSILHLNTSCVLYNLTEFHARTLRTPISNFYS